MREHPIPTEQDRKNYSVDIRTSPFFSKPDEFLKLGQKCRARFRVFDLPNKSENDWGWVSAEAGVVATCISVNEGRWPTVQFPGAITDVTDFEVEALDEFEEQASA